MASNRCRLTEKGMQVARQALADLGLKPDNMKGLAEKLQLDDITIHRTTLRKMLKYPLSTVWYDEIKSLFDWLDQKLQKKQRPGLKLQENLHYVEYEGESKPKGRTQSNKVSELNKSEKVAELLWSLDYDDQEASFRKALKLVNSAGAFLVQAEGTEVQTWLVKRLARQIPNFENAKKFSFHASRHPMRWEFDALWADLSKRLSVETSDRDSVIQSLSNLCQHQPVIVAVYGFRRLDNQKIAALQEFWCQLLKNVSDLKKRTARSRLILFLADEPDQPSNDSCPFQFVAPSRSIDPNCPILLESLRALDIYDIKGWFEQDEVYDFLSVLFENNHIENLINHDRWSRNPKDALDQICLELQLSKGLADIEQYWTLAS